MTALLLCYEASEPVGSLPGWRGSSVRCQGSGLQKPWENTSTVSTAFSRLRCADTLSCCGWRCFALVLWRLSTGDDYCWDTLVSLNWGVGSVINIDPVGGAECDRALSVQASACTRIYWKSLDFNWGKYVIEKWIYSCWLNKSAADAVKHVWTGFLGWLVILENKEIMCYFVFS